MSVKVRDQIDLLMRNCLNWKNRWVSVFFIFFNCKSYFEINFLGVQFNFFLSKRTLEYWNVRHPHRNQQLWLQHLLRLQLQVQVTEEIVYTSERNIQIIAARDVAHLHHDHHLHHHQVNP